MIEFTVPPHQQRFVGVEEALSRNRKSRRIIAEGAEGDKETRESASNLQRSFTNDRDVLLSGVSSTRK